MAAHKKAIERISIAVHQLLNNPESVLPFRQVFKWEGLFTPKDLRKEKEKIDEVIKIYRKSLAGLKAENFNYECDYKEDWNFRCEEGDLAWAMTGVTSPLYDIHICWGFFTSETLEDQADTIIHEAVHKWGGVNHGPDPLNNAYNYESFINRLAQFGVLMVQPQPLLEDEEEKLIQPKPLSEPFTPLVQKQFEGEEEEELLQSKARSGQIPEVTQDLESCILSLKSAGQALPESARNFFEPRFGQDFSQVRVHTDTRAAEFARAVNARAFTLGCNIFLGAGHFAPEEVAGRKLLAHELTHVVQQKNEYKRATLQRWKLKSSEDCLVKGVNRAKSLLTGNLERAELAYGKWGCKTKDFIDDGKGPEFEIKYGGIQCGLSWKVSTGEDLISINPGLIDCCKDCPSPADAVEMIAHTLIHETAHWCAATHKESARIEHGDDVEKAIFGGVHMLENCVIKKVSSYGDKPCFSCPYVVKEGDSLWKIAEKLYANGSKWRRIYEANRKLIGDDPNLIHPGMRLTIPTLKVVR